MQEYTHYITTKHDVMPRLYVCNEVHLHTNHDHTLTACPLVEDITHMEH